MVGKCVLCSAENVELFPFYKRHFCEKCRLEREVLEEELDNTVDWAAIDAAGYDPYDDYDDRF